MPHITHYMPELSEPERTYIQGLIGRMSHGEIQIFASAYRQRRKDPHTVLLTSIVGLVAIPGFQRFWLGQIAMGFLYLFTWGLVLVGTISDVVRYRELTFAYNKAVSDRIAANILTQPTDHYSHKNPRIFSSSPA
jgi:TM2 domain-containing membrane protein YozV